MNQRGYFYTPDFVILGVPADDGVYIYASTDLTRAELEAVADEVDTVFDGYFRRFQHVNYRYIITATMRTVVVVKGATYAEAFRALFAHWTPPEPERKGITEGDRSLAECRKDVDAPATQP